MKRLLIHIGYPKTATTSLQEGLFFKLHNLGKINYLGRTTKSTHTRWGNSQFSGEDWVVHFRKHFIFNNPLPSQHLPLRDDILNVISDEDLTIHGFFHLVQFGVQKNSLDTANLLRELAINADEIEILLTLRNQVDLIQSCYLQKYRFIYSPTNEVSFREFLLDSSGNVRIETAEIFDFQRVTSHYMSIFNKRVNLLIFEDLKHNREHFFNSLGKIMKFDGAFLSEIFGNEHFRKKVDKTNKRMVKVSEPSTMGKLYCLIRGVSPNQKYFNKRWYMSYSFFQNLEKIFFIKSKIVKTPEISREERQIIFDYFKYKNLQFASENQLDIQLLSKYGYI